ncbi:MAG: protein translocase subunit SecF [Candidatus Paceibacterota bacterium]|jgi:preprotein translocase subunit SecF
MNIVTYRTVYFWITGIILAGALGAIFFFGLPLDVDFTGGSLMQVSYQSERPAISEIEQQVATVPLGTVFIRASDTDAVSIRTRTMTPAEHDAVLGVLARSASTTEISYTSVGPTLGGQFASKALWAILAVALAIILYIAFAFRKVSRPVPSWGYGLAVIVCLLHDLIIPTGLFAILAHFSSVQVDALFVTALLALLGYSVNDTIVIFDRVREHLAYNEKTRIVETFEQTVGKSISETMTRSINTSLTVVLALLALVLFGAAATRTFSLVMLVGVIAGTYSSILLAAPLLIPLARKFAKK